VRNFFTELKRRRVYRTGLYYAAGSWLLVQIADIVLENFNLPERFMQLFIVCVVLGFPIVLVLAWIFDIGRGGIRRTSAAPTKKQVESADTEAKNVAAGGDDRPGIVVLPFDSFSDQPRDQIVSDCFTEDLTTLVARLPGFFVISRNTAYSYKGNMKDLREIGKELGVRYLLEGSIRKKGDQLRITAQLIEASTGSHLWADNFDSSIADLGEIQDALVRGIAVQLDVELARAEFRLARRRQPKDMDAWSLYQDAKGTLMFMGWSEKSVRQAAQQLRRAIEIDPEYASPRAYLSLLLALAHWIKLVDDPDAAHDESVEAADVALELEPNSSEVLGFVGCAFSDLGYKHRGIPLLQKAMELDPSNAQARAALGAAQIATGNLDAGVVTLTNAIQLSPKDPGLAPWSAILALGEGYRGDLDSAAQWIEMSYRSDPRFVPGLVVRAWVLCRQGKTTASQASFNEAVRLNPKVDEEYIRGFLGATVLEQMQNAGVEVPAVVT